MKNALSTAALAATLALAACGGGGGAESAQQLTPEQASWMQFKALADQCQAGTDTACAEALKLAPPDLVAQAQATGSKKQADILWILIAGPIMFPYPGTAGTGTHIVPN